jgi:hypothetical protein
MAVVMKPLVFEVYSKVLPEANLPFSNKKKNYKYYLIKKPSFSKLACEDVMA